jgi:C-terminal processing protease CtpA/Prc
VPLGAPVEPFSIKPGSSFTASGGSPGAAEKGARISEITADIREAEEIIRRNQVDGRSLSAEDLTSAAMDGALRSLDPHSNFFKPAEWR